MPAGRPLKSFAFVTLGCKSNQYDTAAMAADLKAAGLGAGRVPDADIVVINTCMVTSSTEAQCRKAIRQARRQNPTATLVVTGCMSSGSRQQIASIPGVDIVLEPAGRSLLPAKLGLDVNSNWVDWPSDPALTPRERDRAFLKVQDGCDSSCSFCVVPSVRGAARSLPPGRAVPAVLTLIEEYPEVVLCGIHLGRYGMDLAPSTDLERLLGELLSRDWDGRLRLSSIEPLELTDGLLDLVAGSGGRVCRHLHLPLQSGSDRILRSMGRPYGSEDFIRAVARAREKLPGVGMGCDVICGYPGETEADFRLTERLVRDLGIPFLHAFPYSPRPGTRASLLTDDVPFRIKKERVRRLGEVAQENRRSFARSMVGQVLLIAPEGGARGGIPGGLSDNYLRVRLYGKRPSGEVLPRVLCTEEQDGILWGRLVGERSE